MKKPKKLIARIPVVGHFYARPRLALGALCGVLIFLAVRGAMPCSTALLTAWDGGVLFYMILAGCMMAQAGGADIRRQAAAQGDSGTSVLVTSVLAGVATLGAIIVELGAAKQLQGWAQGQHVGLAALTVILSWIFVQTMFAIHYAHAYYADNGHGADKGGLHFPGGQKGTDEDPYVPDYGDFMYFSFVIGAAAQTADVSVCDQSLRRLAGLHCVIAFFFNTTILALTVNIGASLF